MPNERLQQLIEIGERRLRNNNDRKTYIQFDDVQYLIQKGAVVETKNMPQAGGGFLQEVVCQGKLWYVTITTKPMNYA